MVSRVHYPDHDRHGGRRNFDSPGAVIRTMLTPRRNAVVRRIACALLGPALALGAAGALPAAAVARTSQLAMIQDGSDLTTPDQTFQEFRSLGANTVRIILNWNSVLSPAAQTSKSKPAGFVATDPNAAPYTGWGPYDAAVQAAKKYRLKIDFTVTGGAPRWAEGKDIPKEGIVEPNFAWKPSASAYGQFMTAAATRYDGSFTPKGASSPLPRVSFWVIYNEPNFGEDLGPQATNTSRTLLGASLYRGIVDAGWKALQAKHKHDTILIGELAARGTYLSNGHHGRTWPQGLPGNYGQTRALYFLRSLYCLGTNFKPLTGAAARKVSCPTKLKGFRAAHPGLFNASGFGDHPYPVSGSPTTDGRTTDYATFPELGKLESTLDRANAAWGSHKHYVIYNDEYGYITNPPNAEKSQHYVSPAKAAQWINWAEYLSYKSSRVASYMQYLLKDPPPNEGLYSGFASGLEFYSGKHKPGYDAFRLPVFMPKTALRKSTNAELWGAARPAPFETAQGAQTVGIQLNGKTIKRVTPSRTGGYFDIKLRFPSSGRVRLAYTYPASDPLVPVGLAGHTVYSRSFTISVH